MPSDDIDPYIYALDLTTGALKYNSPRRITYTFPSGITITDAGYLDTKSRVLLFNNFCTWVPPMFWRTDLDYHTQEGFIQTFQADDLSVLLANFETTPTGQGGGFWQAGRGIAADASGNVFVAVDSGMYNPLMSFAPSVLKFSPGTLSPISWFTPANWDALYYANLDLSANGVTLIPNTDFAFAGGKAGVIYLVNQTNLGGLEPGAEHSPARVPSLPGLWDYGLRSTSSDRLLAATRPSVFVCLGCSRLSRAYPFDLVSRRFLITTSPWDLILPSRAGGMT